MKTLVSILIPAYNAQKTVAWTLRSALAQTWRHKEIVVVNDGSTDRTPDIVRSFADRGVVMYSKPNGGLCSAQNYAYNHCRGDYIQWLDADDLLAPDKIERQLAALRPGDRPRVLLSSPWAPFYHRTTSAKFVRNSVWQDLSPVDWLLRKMSEGLHMQNATWLVSRELSEAAGPWDESLFYDQDGEYFSRVLLQSLGTRFVPETGIYYRQSAASTRISYIGNSRRKVESLFRSMTLHMKYLRSLEESERVNEACVAYIQLWYEFFYPGHPDLVAQLQALASEMNGSLKQPALRSKFAWIAPVFGSQAARWAQRTLPELRSACARAYDRAMFDLTSPNRRALS